MGKIKNPQTDIASSDENKYESMILKCLSSEEYYKLTAYYSKKSIFNIIGMARREEVHSNFLAWLLNSERNYGLETVPLEKLIQLLSHKAYDMNNQKRDFPKEWMKSLLIGNYEITDVKVTTEKVVPNYLIESKTRAKKGVKKRIDILAELTIEIDSKSMLLPIIIENKVYSDEHGTQTNAYYSWGSEHEYKDKVSKGECLIPIYVFLTIDGKDAECEHYFTVTYQELLDHVIEPCKYACNTDFAENYINEYIRCLTVYDIGQEEKEKKKKGVMAMNKEERELIKDFYNKNSDLIMAIASVMQDDESLDPEGQEAAKNLSKAMETRDLTKYSFGDKHNLGKTRVPLEVVKKYVTLYPDVTFDDFQKDFPQELHKNKNFYKAPEEMTDDEKKRKRFIVEDKIQLKDKTIVISRMWGRDKKSKKDYWGEFVEYVNGQLAKKLNNTSIVEEV